MSDTYLHDGYTHAELQEFKDKCRLELAYWEQQLAECGQAERNKRHGDDLRRVWERWRAASKAKQARIEP